MAQFVEHLPSICRTLRVRVPPEADLLLRKRELSSGVIALLCLVSMTDRSCTYMHCVGMPCTVDKILSLLVTPSTAGEVW